METETPETIHEEYKLWDRLRREGDEAISAYWTIGRYDTIVRSSQ